MKEKAINERGVETVVPRFRLNFLGAMPGYGHEYRLTVESGASVDSLGDMVHKLKRILPDWSID